MIKTVSLETAKLLKEAGFRQDTHFNYVLCWGKWNLTDKVDKFEGDEQYSSPTTDELLEDINGEGLMSYYARALNDGDTSIGNLYTYTQDIIDLFKNPDKLADCWLWLKKEGLIGGGE